MKTIILLTIVGLLLIISSSNAKNSFNDKNAELTNKQARMFLRAMFGDDSGNDDDDLPSFDARQTKQNCVRCKFRIADCCVPNICKRHTIMPNECLEVKTGK